MKNPAGVPKGILTNVRLHPEMLEQARIQATKQGHITFSAYIRYLLLQDIKNASKGK